VSGGVGIAMVNADGGFSSNFVVPFGLGMKLQITKRLGVAGQWEFRKTFSDLIDGYNFPQTDEFSSKLHNNDWYYTTGISISYKINYNKLLCPAYDD